MNPLTLIPSSCLWLLFVSSLCILSFSNQNSDHVLCIPSERLALIDLQTNLTDRANRLSSWVGKDCCSWSGVVCDNLTGHVHEIHFGQRQFDDDFCDRTQSFGGSISPSVIKLSQLRYLDLSCNDFRLSSIPAFIGSFENLRYLNISKTHFSGEIPHQLGNLSALRVLDLHGSDNLHSKSLKWLENLKGLRHLDMSGVDLTEASDWFPVISNLTSLQELHLSWCGLNNQLPSNPTIVNFTSLVVLDLSNNYVHNIMLPGWIFHCMPSLRALWLLGNKFVESSSFVNGVSTLSNLRLLHVSECRISSPILGNLQNLSLLEDLDLSDNEIDEEIPKSLRNLCSFTTLDLSSNKFSGNVSELLERFCECESPKLELLDFSNNSLTGQLPEALGKLKNLVSIDLSSNQLTGTIPDSLGSLSLLQTLDINTNELSGSIPDTVGRLTKLSFLSLYQNSLTGIVTENHFTNLTALDTLWVGDNKLVFKLNVNNWIPPFNLSELDLGSCSLGPQFPSWIQSQTSLEGLDVSNANISDTIPTWIWTTFSNMRYFNISQNNIQGELGDVTFLGFGAEIDLSNNHLHGPLPGNFNSWDIDFLDLSNNNFSGSLNQFLCSGIQESRPLYFLNLANNSMSGVIPDCWLKWNNLNVLNLEKNNFSGIIPSSLGNISSLLSLGMDDNMLSGNLPPWLLNSNSLVIIELAENKLTGNLPIGRNNTSLRVLSLRSNNIEGKIQDELCHLSYLQVLDLAHNDLSGNLLTCFTNFSVLSGRETSNPIVLPHYQPNPDASLVTKGNTYTYSTILYQVTLIDLSDNKFSGPIPDELVGLLGLRFLNLSHNNLTGTIPNSFNQSGILESLDLSVNHLLGNIPLSISQLTTLNCLNVSYNKLIGRIPTGRQFQTFDEFSFIGNALCGAPLPACLSGDIEGTNKGHEHDSIDWILVILTLAGLGVGFWIVVIPLFISRRWRHAHYHFLDEIWFKLQNVIFLLFLCLTRRFRSI